MFITVRLPFGRLLPRIRFENLLRHRAATHQNHLDPEEMPDGLQRDLGLLDGRNRRGEPQKGHFRAATLIYTQRSL